jgi:hypothetical protein
MEFHNYRKVTRRKFVKGLAGAVVCGACFPLVGLADAEVNTANKNGEGKGNEGLAAACGTYCGACPAYLAKHNDDYIKMKQQKEFSSEPQKAMKGIPPSNWMDGLLCDGCLSGGTLAPHCQRCNIRLCALEKQKDAHCAGCSELPCARITNLIMMGNYLHRAEYLPNLEKIRRMGVQDWVKYEEKRWSCPKCGLPLSWYDAKCVGCGEPRSKDLFHLE